MIRRLCLLLAMATMLLPFAATAGEPIRIGYWTGGSMQGFGATLETRNFLEAEGLTPEFVHFADINGPARAVATRSVDVGFAPTTGSFSLAAEGGQIEIVLATQVAEADFMVATASPIRTIDQLAGTRLGVSPAGSTMHALTLAVLHSNYGLDGNAVTVVPGADPKLAQLLAQGDIDVAVLRRIIVDGLPEAKLRRIGTLGDEWQRMTGGTAPPLIAVAIADRTYARGHRDAVTKYVRALIAATSWGAAHTDEVASLLRNTAALDETAALANARQWSRVFVASLTPANVETLHRMDAIFHERGILEKTVPPDLIDTSYFTEATAPR